jgi:hypothetical protein
MRKSFLKSTFSSIKIIEFSGISFTAKASAENLKVGILPCPNCSTQHNLPNVIFLENEFIL